MWTRGNVGKKSVELNGDARVSRIRRDPVRAEEAGATRISWWRTDEWEIRTAIIGIAIFALALFILTISISEITSR